MILTRNPRYCGRFRGNIEQIELPPKADLSASLAKYGINGLDILDITLFPPDEIDHAQQRYAADHVSLSQLATRYIGFNPNKPPFNDPKVRRAFALATNQQELAGLAHHSHHTPALGGLVPPGIPGHSADIGLPYSPHQARQLLAEAGYPNGEGFPVVKALMWRPYIPLAAALQKQWRENLGIEMQWEQQLDYDKFIDSIYKDVPHMFIFGWRADFPDPDNFLRSGFKWIGWKDDVYETLLDKAQQTVGQNERTNLHKAADKYLMEEAVLVPLVYVHLHLLVKPWVRSDNWLAPTRWWFWKDALVESSLKPVEPVTSPSSDSHVLRLAWSPIPTLDPTKAYDSVSVGIIFQLFNGLVEESETLEVMPNIARRWEILEGGCKYIFYLRDDVVWSDGVRVTAADFEFAWKRVLDPHIESPVADLLYDIKGAEAFHQGELADPNQVGVQTVDETTLMVELERPVGYFLQLLTVTNVYPIPRHVVERYGEAWTQADNIVTNGPFQLDRWQVDKLIALVRNPLYHGRTAGNVQRIEISMVVDWSPMVDWYKDNKLDSIGLWGIVNPEEKDLARHAAPGEQISFPLLGTLYVGFNVGKPPFDDPKVRRALAMAIDKETLANVIFNGYQSPTTGGFVPLGLPGHSPTIGLPYDPEQARMLLTEAGYPDGRGFPPVTWLAELTDQNCCDYLQQQWRDNLGIDISWRSLSRPELFPSLSRERPHIFIMAWLADYPDPDNFLRVGILPESEWQNDVYTELVEQARHMLNHDERIKLYQQADKLLIEAAALVPLTNLQTNLMVKPWLKNVRVLPTNRPNYKDVVIEPH